MLPKAVTNAMAVYENAWHDFLRRGFHLQVRPYKDNAACMTAGVSDSVLRAGIRAAAKERGIPFIAGWGPNPDHVMAFGVCWRTTATGYELTIPKKKATERIMAFARLLHSDDGNHWTGPRREGPTVLVVRDNMHAPTSVGATARMTAAEKRWLAITRALATNNDIRAQMGLPLFTGGVTVGVTEQEAA